MSDNVNRHTVISSGDEGSARRGSQGTKRLPSIGKGTSIH